MSAPRTPVQRAIFIGPDSTPEYIDPTAEILEDIPHAREWAADFNVRHFYSVEELDRYAAGRTDYIGNLPARSLSPNTWVRFSPTGTNILAENHSLVKLREVTRAVRSLSFIHESFPVDATFTSRAQYRFFCAAASVYDFRNELNPRDTAAMKAWVGQHGADSHEFQLGYSLSIMIDHLRHEMDSDQVTYGDGTDWGLGSDRMRTAFEDGVEYARLVIGNSTRNSATIQSLSRQHQTMGSWLDYLGRQVIANGDLASAVHAAAARMADQSGWQRTLNALISFFETLIDHLIEYAREQFSSERENFNEETDVAIDDDVETIRNRAADGEFDNQFRGLAGFFHGCRNEMLLARIIQAQRHGCRYIGLGGVHLLDIEKDSRFPRGLNKYIMYKATSHEQLTFGLDNHSHLSDFEEHTRRLARRIPAVRGFKWSPNVRPTARVPVWSLGARRGVDGFLSIPGSEPSAAATAEQQAFREASMGSEWEDSDQEISMIGPDPQARR